MGGLKEKISGKKVYFDTNIFIYLHEGNNALRMQISECDVFLTNDKNIKTPEGIEMVIFSD